MTGTCPVCGDEVALMTSADSRGLVRPHVGKNRSRLGGCDGAGKEALEYGDSQKERVWMALQKAAMRIAASEHKAGRYRVSRRNGKVVRGYTISGEHKHVLDTMNALGRDEITPEEAMAVLHEYDVVKARTR